MQTVSRYPTQFGYYQCLKPILMLLGAASSTIPRNTNSTTARQKKSTTGVAPCAIFSFRKFYFDSSGESGIFVQKLSLEKDLKKNGQKHRFLKLFSYLGKMKVVKATFSLVSHCLIKLEGENTNFWGVSSINVKKWVLIHTVFFLYNI